VSDEAVSDGPSGPAGGDARMALIFELALRGLTQQQALVENLNNRVGIVVFATTFASSLLGAQALSNGVDGFDWVALIVFFAIGVLVVLLLWPYQSYRFRFDPNDLLQRYIDAERSISLSDMHRDLAVEAERHRSENWKNIQRLLFGLQATLILLIVEIAAWLISIATS
jgi:hypothetical protein